MPLDFDQHALKGKQFLTELASELGNKKDLGRAGHILRAVFHTLRNHLTLQENFQLLAQLPVALKGVYVEAWQPGKNTSKNRRKYGFVQEVMQAGGKPAEKYFTGPDNALEAVKAVFTVVAKHISRGEYEDLESVLPKGLKKLMEEAETASIPVLKLVMEK